MAKRIFVSNLDFEVTDEVLKQFFAPIGEVVSAVVAADRESGRSKGFGFVEMKSDELVDAAIAELNGKPLQGRPVKVVEDRGKGGSVASDSENTKKFEPLPTVQRTQLFKKKQRSDPFSRPGGKTLDYKDVAILSKFVSERGRILPRKNTGLSAYNQRKLSKMIKRAQHLGLMGFTSVHR